MRFHFVHVSGARKQHEVVLVDLARISSNLLGS